MVLIEEPLDGFAPLLVRRPVPGHLDGRLGQASTDTQAAVGIVSLGGQIGDASGPGKLSMSEAIRPRMATIRSWEARTRWCSG